MPKLTVKDQPKKEKKSRLSPDAPDIHWDDNYEGFEDTPIPPKRITPIKPKRITIDENTFLVWVKGLNPAEYPICNGVIKRLQTHQRKSFILDILRLINIYLQGDH